MPVHPFASSRATLLAVGLLSLGLVAPARAAPGAGEPRPKPTTGPPRATDVVPGTPSPRFAGAVVDDAYARSLVATTDTFLGYARCDAPGGHGLYLSGCLALIVGTATKHALIQLIDTPCPRLTPASACYAGYVIAVRADADVRYDPATGTQLATTEFRIGLVSKTRTSGPRGTRAGTTKRYRLGPNAVMTQIQTVRVVGMSKYVELKITVAGTTIVDDAWSTQASGSTTCAEQGELVTATGTFVADVAAFAVFVQVAGGGILAGGLVAATGVGAALGVAITATGAAIATGLALATRELGRSAAQLTGLIHREACERLRAVGELEPEELAAIEKAAARTMSAGPGLGIGTPATCHDEVQETSFSNPDGTQVHSRCVRGWTDGECRTACTEVTEAP